MYQIPDSEAASLQLTINYILSVPKEEQLEKIKKASSSDSHMLQGMPKRLQAVFKDASLFVAIVKLNPYSILWTPRIPTTHAVFNWRPAGAPVSHAVDYHFLDRRSEESFLSVVHGGHHSSRSPRS